MGRTPRSAGHRRHAASRGARKLWAAHRLGRADGVVRQLVQTDPQIERAARSDDAQSRLVPDPCEACDPAQPLGTDDGIGS